MNENWITIVDYARQFSISDMTVRRRIRTGKINAELRNGKYYIPRSEVEKKKKQKNTEHQPAAFSPVPPPSGRENVLSPISRTPEANPNPFNTSTIENNLTAESFKNMSPPPTKEAPVPAQPSSNTNVDALMTLWKESMRLSKETEYRINEQFQAKLETFQEKEKNYQLQIKQLEQKTEDLELLINILEKNHK